MSMTMSSTRLTDGQISKEKLSRRYQNLLNLVYLQSQPAEGGGYRIPEKVFEQIQTELDFNAPEDEAQTQKLESQIKKRYRQRDSYRFWKDFLDVANIESNIDAKEYLMRIFQKLDDTRHYGSMTHSFYALETMQLALDDTYGTNSLVLQQYKFANPNAKKPNNKKKTKAQKLKALKQDEEDELLF
jgi:hypothetical protein